MNYRMIARMIGRILLIEGLFMLPALGISLFQGDEDSVRGFGQTIVLCAAAGVATLFVKARSQRFFAREGFVIVGLAWVMVSLVGGLPFYLSGSIPSYVDCVFESVSGFTTTGASILSDVEGLDDGILYWRSFTHWLGGMGVLVFALAVVPRSTDNSNSMHILRAESPGPQTSKLVPRTRQTAAILYGIYVVLTAIQIVMLLFDGVPALDAVTIAYGSAGTGGFSIKNDSLAGYSHYTQTVTTIFMALFGVNFNIYYMLLLRMFTRALFNDELRAYLLIMLGATVAIALNTLGMYDSAYESFHHAAFQVSSIMTTTGFATVDFHQWPTFSHFVLLLLMVCGACAGSTGGGIKVSRLLILLRSVRHSVYQNLHPNTVRVMHLNGEAVDDGTVRNVFAFMTLYAIIAVVMVLLLSLDGFSIVTSLTAMLATLNNVGPGLDMVGPMGNYSAFSPMSKLVLSAGMLIGRLEIFPFITLFTPSIWKK